MGGRPIAARGAAQAEVDPSRVKRLERPELLGDHERSMVREHDCRPPRRGSSMFPPRRARSRPTSPHSRCPAYCVMLGEPKAVKPSCLGVPCEVDRIAERVRRRPALDDRREVEDRKRYSQERSLISPRRSSPFGGRSHGHTVSVRRSRRQVRRPR